MNVLYMVVDYYYSALTDPRLDVLDRSEVLCIHDLVRLVVVSYPTYISQ